MESKGDYKTERDYSLKGESKRPLLDDIHCLHWLQEVGMEQYAETFKTNFTNGGEYLSRKRLSQVQLRHFPHMNITNFEHQKILRKHISKVLEKEFVDQTRLALMAEEKEKIEAKLRADRGDKRGDKKGDDSNEGGLKIIGVVKDDSAKMDKRRQRYSFEDKAWEIISKSRGETKGAYDHLKDADEIHVDFMAKEKSVARKGTVRRRSFESGDINTAHGKAMLFGNMAMEFDTLQNKMIIMQSKYLNEIKTTVGCEQINMLFLNDKTRELMLCIDQKWYRVPCESGTAGYSIVTGETVNIQDAYADYRFNSSVDKATGFVTKNILCQPVRANRGGGRVIGVIELKNKTGETPFFTELDEEVLVNMTSQITDVLYSEFQELVNINESLSAFATPILPTGPERRENGNKKGYELGTASSSSSNPSNNPSKFLARKDSLEGKFVVGKHDDPEKEKGRARVTRRKSFGEDLNAEIQANPELLHVRKD